MKKYSICSYIDIIHVSLIDSIVDGIATLKTGASWTRINAKNKITYSSITDVPSAGAILKETIIFPSNIENAISLLDRKENYILRLVIDDAEILIGDLKYPAKKVYSDDKISTTITFSRISAL